MQMKKKMNKMGMFVMWTKLYFIPVSVAVCIHASLCLVHSLGKFMVDLLLLKGLEMVKTWIKEAIEI